MKLETVDDAITYAMSVASYAGHATVHLLLPDGDDHRHWLTQQELSPAAAPQVAIDLEAARFVAEAGAIPGEALFRFAAGRGLHDLPYDSWAEQPIAVRLPIEAFIGTFLASHKLARAEVDKFEAAMREADALVQRTPLRDTIFSNGDEDGPLEDFGPVGQAAAAEAPAETPLSASPANAEPAGDAGGTGDQGAGATTAPAEAVPVDGQVNLGPAAADPAETTQAPADPSAAAPADLPASEPLTEPAAGDTGDGPGVVPGDAGTGPVPVDVSSSSTAGEALSTSPAPSTRKRK